MNKIPKNFKSTKDTYYAALTLIIRANRKNIFDLKLPSILTLHIHFIQFTESVAYYGLESRL